MLEIYGCGKEKNFETALIRDTSNPAANGCGWVVEISSTIYKPTNIEA